MRRYLVLIILLTSCRYYAGKRVSGDGNVTDKTLSVGSFERVEVSGAMDVHLAQGPARDVKLRADANLFSYVDIHVEGNALIVREKPGYNLRPTSKLIVFVQAPELSGVEVSGACDIVGVGSWKQAKELSLTVSGAGEMHMAVDAPSLRTETSGSGKIALRGHVSKFSAQMAGAGEVKCFDLVADDVTIDVSGAGNADVYANKTLDVHVSGAGDVHYKGNPRISQEVSGAGSVKRVE